VCVFESEDAVAPWGSGCSSWWKKNQNKQLKQA
jgi:hypothetical protein